MGYDRDRIAWLKLGKEKLGSQGALGRYLGMKKQQISRLMHGHGDLKGEQLDRLLKLIKILPCVLAALALAGHQPEAGATGMHSERGRAELNNLHIVRVYNLHIVQRWKSFLRWLSLPSIGRAFQNRPFASWIELVF